MAITPESRELAVIPQEFAQDLTRSSNFPGCLFPPVKSSPIWVLHKSMIFMRYGLKSRHLIDPFTHLH
jgi:hypothetical protein